MWICMQIPYFRRNILFPASGLNMETVTACLQQPLLDGHSVILGKVFPTKPILRGVKQVKVWWCKVGTVWWMWQNSAPEFHDGFPCRDVGMGPGIVMLKETFFFLFWPASCNSHLQLLQCLHIASRIDCVYPHSTKSTKITPLLSQKLEYMIFPADGWASNFSLLANPCVAIPQTVTLTLIYSGVPRSHLWWRCCQGNRPWCYSVPEDRHKPELCTLWSDVHTDMNFTLYFQRLLQPCHLACSVETCKILMAMFKFSHDTITFCMQHHTSRKEIWRHYFQNDLCTCRST